MVDWDRHPIDPSGAPAATAAADRSLLVSWMQPAAEGWGLKTMALRPFSAISALLMVVEVGLVEGIIAAITPDRRGDFEDSLVPVLPDDADRPEVFDGFVDKLGAELVLEDLVGDVAEAGFFHGHAGKLLRGSQSSLSHLSDHGIDLVLGESREEFLSLKCLVKQ